MEPITKPPPMKAPPLTAPRQLPLTPPAPAVLRGPIKFKPLGQKKSGHRIVLFGTGGIGKTTLAAHAPGPVAFFDLDNSLERLEEGLGELLPATVDFDGTWMGMRNALRLSDWGDTKTIVIDTMTAAEELCVAHTLATVKGEKGNSISSIEGYGYGKGYKYVYESFLPLLADLDHLKNEGRHVILICHECTATVPNPAGEDFLRYEPRLQNPTSTANSIRARLKDWSDHQLFLGYDVDVTKDGKAKGSGSRTVWTSERPHCMAKCRTTQEPIVLIDPADVWPEIIN